MAKKSTTNAGKEPANSSAAEQPETVIKKTQTTRAKQPKTQIRAKQPTKVVERVTVIQKEHPQGTRWLGASPLGSDRWCYCSAAADVSSHISSRENCRQD